MTYSQIFNTLSKIKNFKKMKKTIFLLTFIVFLFALTKWAREKKVEKEREKSFQTLGLKEPKRLETRKLEADKIYYIRFKRPVREGDKFSFFTEEKNVRVYARRSKDVPWVDITNRFQKGLLYEGDRGIWVKVSRSGTYEFYLDRKE